MLVVLPPPSPAWLTCFNVALNDLFFCRFCFLFPAVKTHLSTIICWHVRIISFCVFSGRVLVYAHICTYVYFSDTLAGSVIHMRTFRVCRKQSSTPHSSGKRASNAWSGSHIRRTTLTAIQYKCIAVTAGVVRRSSPCTVVVCTLSWRYRRTAAAVTIKRSGSGNRLGGRNDKWKIIFSDRSYTCPKCLGKLVDTFGLGGAGERHVRSLEDAQRRGKATEQIRDEVVTE